WSGTGLLLAASSRGGGELVDLPADGSGTGAVGLGPVAGWDAMARVADRGETPTWERIIGDLKGMAGEEEVRSLQGVLTQAWQRWATTYPEAFAEADRIAV